MKYVILTVEVAGILRAHPFIFSERDTHSEVARWMTNMLWREHNDEPHVYSAGFCDFGKGSVEVVKHGSESLKLKSDPDCESRDEQILNMPSALQGMLL